MFNIDWKYFVQTEDIPVFIQVGYGSREITVNGGSLNNSNNPIGDATYLGNGFNFGVGLTHALKDNILFTASVVYRFASFDQVEGTAGRSKLSKPSSLDGGGAGLIFSIAYDVRH